jgi:hypothetical protein
MSETMKIILMVLILIGAFAITLQIAAWKTKRACESILRDLQEKKAFDPVSAVDLPYAKTSIFRMGMRDYRPKALTALVKFDHIRIADGGRFYLRDGHNLHGNP